MRRKRMDGDAMITPTLKKASLLPAPTFTLERDGGYIIARCGDLVVVYAIVWESIHGDPKRTLTLRACVDIPRHLESKVMIRGNS